MILKGDQSDDSDHSSSNKGDKDRKVWSFRPYTWYSHTVPILSSDLPRNAFYLLRIFISCGIVRQLLAVLFCHNFAVHYQDFIIINVRWKSSQAHPSQLFDKTFVKLLWSFVKHLTQPLYGVLFIKLRKILCYPM